MTFHIDEEEIYLTDAELLAWIRNLVEDLEELVAEAQARGLDLNTR
jgi:hypothetical protein